MKKKRKIQTMLPWLLLLGTISLYFIYYVRYIGGMLDADMSSELVLSELLAKEHRLLSKNWLYSTEIRVLNTQLVYRFFFLFTHNYMFVRVASRFVFIGILGLSFCYFCYQAGLKKWAPYLASFLFLPFSGDYAEYVLLGDYYIPHIAISFLSLGLVFKAEAGREKSNIIAYVCLIALSFLAGLGGPRQVFIFYLPLLLTALLRSYQTHKIKLRSVYPAFFASVTGYLVNAKLLSKKYNFSSWESLNFQRYSTDMPERIINGVLKVLGYCEGEVFSYNLVRNLVCFAILTGFILYAVFALRRSRQLPEEEKVTFLYFAISLIIFSLLYVFSDMSYENRYLLPILIFLIPLLGMSLENHNWHPLVQSIAAIIVFIMVLASGLGVYKDFAVTANSDSLRNISQQLVQDGYESGYATYWNGNMIREFSNGKLDIYCWEEDIEEIIDVDMMFEWLQEKRHLEEKPQGKVFILISSDQVENCPLLRYQIEDRLVWVDEEYVVYGFDSYEAMITRLSTYTYDLSETEFLNAGEYTEDTWILREAGTTRGPHMTLYTGVYYVTVAGENLRNLQMTATADFGEITLESECIEQSDSKAVFEVNAYQNAHYTEFILQNTGIGTMKISGVQVERGTE